MAIRSQRRRQPVYRSLGHRPWQERHVASPDAVATPRRSLRMRAQCRQSGEAQPEKSGNPYSIIPDNRGFEAMTTRASRGAVSVVVERQVFRGRPAVCRLIRSPLRLALLSYLRRGEASFASCEVMSAKVVLSDVRTSITVG